MSICCRRPHIRYTDPKASAFSMSQTDRMFTWSRCCTVVGNKNDCGRVRLPVPLIAGFGLAAEIAAARMQEDQHHLCALRDRLWHGIRDLPGLLRNGDPEQSYPGLLNVSAAGVDGESLLLALEPLCVATGSACNATNQDPSYVLRALGRSDLEAQSAIRFSLGRPTTETEVDYAVEHYRAAINRLRELAPGRAV